MEHEADGKLCLGWWGITDIMPGKWKEVEEEKALSAGLCLLSHCFLSLSCTPGWPPTHNAAMTLNSRSSSPHLLSAGFTECAVSYRAGPQPGLRSGWKSVLPSFIPHLHSVSFPYNRSHWSVLVLEFLCFRSISPHFPYSCSLTALWISEIRSQWLSRFAIRPFLCQDTSDWFT